jgi:hypothetical protein
MIHDGLLHGYSKLLSNVGGCVWLRSVVLLVLFCLCICILLLKLTLALNMLDLRFLP